MQCCTFKPTCFRQLNPAGQSSLFVQCWTVCILEGHLVNLIHHQISGDLILNFKNDWTAVCIFSKMLPKRGVICRKKLFISHYSWEPRYLFVWPKPQVCPLYVWSAGRNPFCTISDTSAWSTYIIRILVPHV